MATIISLLILTLIIIGYIYSCFKLDRILRDPNEKNKKSSWQIKPVVIYFNYSKGRENKSMINIRTLKKITDNGGLTLKKGKVITYKSGWQVATEGIETTDMKEAMKAIKAYNGNCGIWFSNGVWYIDKSKRISTKREALIIGRACNQISILRWSNMGLAYC